VDSLITSPGSAQQVGSFIANWKNTAGIADDARMLGLTVVRAETPDDKAAIEAAESEIAENSPTSSRVWQDLAQSRLKRGASMESVLAAFHMSDLTGSHEGGTMMQRALFGLEHWSELPEADRRVVIRRVAATMDTEYRNLNWIVTRFAERVPDGPPPSAPRPRVSPPLGGWPLAAAALISESARNASEAPKSTVFSVHCLIPPPEPIDW